MFPASGVYREPIKTNLHSIPSINVKKQWNKVTSMTKLFPSLSKRAKVCSTIYNGQNLRHLSIISVKCDVLGEVVVTEDEFPRPGCTMDALTKLRPAFVRDGSGTVTAGNASGKFYQCSVKFKAGNLLARFALYCSESTNIWFLCIQYRYIHLALFSIYSLLFIWRLTSIMIYVYIMHDIHSRCLKCFS